MKKLIIGVTVSLFCLFLIYNHNQLPTKDDVIKMTGDLFPKAEEVYTVQKTGDDWVTIFRNDQSILACDSKIFFRIGWC